MSKPERLTQAEIDAALKHLPGWHLEGDAIVKMFEFADFPEAVAFVGSTVEPAESAGHHPDLDIRYNKVRVLLTTHDAGGLSKNDIEMAARLNRCA